MKTLVFTLVLIIETLVGAWAGLGGYLHLAVRGSVISSSAAPGSYEVDSIVFKTAEEALVYLEDSRTCKHFPWFKDLTDGELLFLACTGCGLIGGVIAIVLRIARGQLKVEQGRVISIPLLGLLTGWVVVLVVQFLPDSVMTFATRKPLGLPGISLLAGIFFSLFYRWLADLFKKTGT